MNELLITFILGTIIGSFLNVCIYRIPRNESIVYPSSHCPKCNNKLRWYDLIPIVSYILLKGRCRYCKGHISLKYPIIEFMTGILYSIVILKYGLSIDSLKYVILSSILIVISLIDIKTMYVYFNGIILGVIIGLVFILVEYLYKTNQSQLLNLLAGIIGFSIIALIILLTNGMGWGDAEICFVCGLFIGIKLTIVMMIFSFLFACIVSLILMAFKRFKMKSKIPFAPFISSACIFAIIFGKKILVWYINLL